MLVATLTQMWSQARRLVSAGLAVMLGTAFIAASLLAVATMQQATDDGLTARFARADLVLFGVEANLPPEYVAAVRAVPGVAAADASNEVPAYLIGPRATEYVGVTATPSDPRLELAPLIAGRAAADDTEVVLGQGVADRLGLKLGDDVSVEWSPPQLEPAEKVTVVGLTADLPGPLGDTVGMQVTPETLAARLPAMTSLGEAYDMILIAAEPGADVAAVQAEVIAIPIDSTIEVQTRAQIADGQRADATGSTATFTVLLFGFAAVALVVAAVVVANTFQVLVAQRARSLALMRCVGATRGQVYRSVLVEASAIGILSSVAGVALGSLVVVVGVRVLAERAPELGLNRSVAFSPEVVLLPILVGLVATVLAALVPARYASAVPPVEALQPVEGAPAPGASTARAVLTISALVVGGVLMVGGVVMAVDTRTAENEAEGVLLALGVGILGGVVSLVGVLAGSVFVVPPIVRALGVLTGRGASARLATANAVRNPRRTAATANALIIAVGLVVMMSAGAWSARETLSRELDTSFPVDMTLMTVQRGPLLPDQMALITEYPGVAASAPGHAITVEGGGESATWSLDLIAFTSGDPAGVYRDPGLLAGLTDDVVIVDPSFVNFSDPVGTVKAFGGEPIPVKFRYANVGSFGVITPALLQRLDSTGPVNALWVRFAADADGTDVFNRIKSALDSYYVGHPDADFIAIDGPAIARAQYEQIITTMLAVLLGLLAVAVVIALIGVANTLSLSVIERSRESATLRAMGMTGAQLRRMLAVEGLLVAVVGALVGSVAGLVYGWVGAAIALSRIGTVAFATPWPILAGVMVIAVVAGLIASVLPARSALRRSPVEALGNAG